MRAAYGMAAPEIAIAVLILVGIVVGYVVGVRTGRRQLLEEQAAALRLARRGRPLD